MPVFRYSPALGAAYAQSFALPGSVPDDQKLFYVSEGDDCTNFISQCIWAAYGGWVPGFSPSAVEENRERIKKNVRQTDVWYGSRYYIGSNTWCRVEELYSYATNLAKPLGPAAREIARTAPAEIDPASVRLGDVIQLVVLSYTKERFGHGLYVTKAGSSINDILVCCHTFDRLNIPLGWFAQYPDDYSLARVLRFEAAEFVT